MALRIILPDTDDGGVYASGEQPARGDHVTHYVDRDHGVVQRVYRENGRTCVDVCWSGDSIPAAHHADECFKAGSDA